MKSKRPITILSSHVVIPLAGGGEAICDIEDAELVGQHNWSLSGSKRKQYVVTAIHRKNVRLHYLLTGCHNIDHINGDQFDNRRSNMRRATHQQQSFNRRPNRGKKYKGVSRERGHYRAKITIHRRTLHLGMFDDERDAARAYDRKAIELFGSFARTNFRYLRRSTVS